MALLVGSTSIDGSGGCCPPPAWSTDEVPLGLLPRVEGMLGVLLGGVGVVFDVGVAEGVGVGVDGVGVGVIVDNL